MAINHKTYSDEFLKSVQPSIVQVTKKYNQRLCESWQYSFKSMNIIQMSIPDLLTSNE